MAITPIYVLNHRARPSGLLFVDSAVVAQGRVVFNFGFDGSNRLTKLVLSTKWFKERIASILCRAKREWDAIRTLD